MKKIFFLAVIAFSCQSKQEIKRDQYFVEGLELYKLHCANCHQTDGTGLKNLYPPLANSGYLTQERKAKIACAIRYGQADSLVIKGHRYTQPMPGNAQLQPLDIAEITTFIYNQWGNEKTTTETADVKIWLEGCGK